MRTTAKNIPIKDLPLSINEIQAVELSYGTQLDQIIQRLLQGYKVLIRCDKGLNNFLYPILRKRIKRVSTEFTITLIDGRVQQEGRDLNRIQGMLSQITEFVRGGVLASQLAFMTHLDLLSTSQTNLSPEAKELIPLLYEHPHAHFCALVDPSFPLPKALVDVFDFQFELEGVQREVLADLITQREARALDYQLFDPYLLYPYLSGLNALKLRRLLSSLSLQPEASPLSKTSGQEALRSLREQTAQQGDGLELPQVSLQDDIAGYEHLKIRIQHEFIDLALARLRLDDPEEIKMAESLTPKGILFYGPPGTGKTYFAKAIATALQASLIVVSGPELKSKWVGESEENLRRMFRKARAASPTVIVFDEIDSFAQARGSYQSSGVEHSMVNQLLTEMDGFRSNEQVFIVGTTNFLASVDHALLRPGRFELLIEVPAPDEKTRIDLLKFYNQRFNLGLSDSLITWLGEQTSEAADTLGNPYSADHIKGLCRALKREILLKKLVIKEEVSLREYEILDVMNREQTQVTLTAEERKVIAMHECGHALVSMLLPRTSTPSRVSIRPDAMSLGRVYHNQNRSRFVYTPSDFQDEICVLLGGLVAEEITFKEHSIGAAQDLQQASLILKDMALKYGMSPLGLTSHTAVSHSSQPSRAIPQLSEQRLAELELWLNTSLETLKQRTKVLLDLNLQTLNHLCKQLLAQDELNAQDLKDLNLVLDKPS